MARGSSAKLRTTALLSAGALVVHELRYRLAFGDDAPTALSATGHGYLAFVTPVVVLVGLLGVASIVDRLGRGDGSRAARRRSIWLTLAAALLGVFSLQELLEGVFATGHADGLAGVFGQGGWLAAPVSMAVAGAVLAFVHVAEHAPLAGVATRLSRLLRLDSPVSIPRPTVSRAGRPLARHLAGRAPPVRV